MLCPRGFTTVLDSCLPLSTPFAAWSQDDWGSAAAVVVGPARNRTHVFNSPDVAIARRTSSLAPLLEKVVAEEQRLRSPKRICASSSDYSLCFFAVTTLRSLAVSSRMFPSAKGFDSDDQAEVRRLASMEAERWWSIVFRAHWTAAAWPSLLVYAIALELYAETKEAEQRPQEEGAAWSFGANWYHMVSSVYADKTRRKAGMEIAKTHLLGFLGRQNLSNLTFLDVGCGAGLNSWAALAAGARQVLCVDIDEASRESARQMRATAEEELDGALAGRNVSSAWLIRRLNISDPTSLSEFHGWADIVYCHGVAHHTPDPWRSVENLLSFIRQDRGVMYLGLYPLEAIGGVSGAAGHRHNVLRYRAGDAVRRQVYELERAFEILLITFTLNSDMKGFIQSGHTAQRGTSFWADMRDHWGGWPVHYMGTRAVIDFIHDRGFEVLLARSYGQTEFLVWRPSGDSVVAGINATMSCEDLRSTAWIPTLTTTSRRSGFSMPATLHTWIAKHADTDEGLLQSRRVQLRENGRIFGHPSATSILREVHHPGGVLSAYTTAYGVSPETGLTIFYASAPEKVKEVPREYPHPARSRFTVCLLPRDEL